MDSTQSRQPAYSGCQPPGRGGQFSCRARQSRAADSAAPGLEWLWRIREEPALWKRYLFDGLLLGRLFVCSVVPLLCRGLWSRRGVLGVETMASTVPEPGSVRLRLSGRLDRDSLPELRESLGELNAGSRLEIDVSGLEYIDASAMGYLYALRYRHHRAQFGISCHGPRARRLFHWHRAGCLLEAAAG